MRCRDPVGHARRRVRRGARRARFSKRLGSRRVADRSPTPRRFSRRRGSPYRQPMSRSPQSVSRHPPRVLSKAAAAAYCRLSESDFGQLVRVKTLPGPLSTGWGWNIVAIDLAIDSISGCLGNSPPAPPPRTSRMGERRGRQVADAAQEAEVDQKSLNPARQRRHWERVAKEAEKTGPKEKQ